MLIIDSLKIQQLQARKNRDSATALTLSTVIGEIETLAKSGKGEMNDAVVTTVIKKFLKNIDETLKLVPSEHLEHEKKLLESFLPRQITEAELDAVIDKLIAEGNTNIGDAMKALKNQHAGTYDGAVASRLLKDKFK